MSNRLDLDQEITIQGIKGIATTIRSKTVSVPDSQCQLLKTEVSEIKTLEDALSIMAGDLNITGDE